MRKIIITDLTDGTTEAIETNVPVCAIRPMIETYIVEESKEEAIPAALNHLKEVAPFLYEECVKNGLIHDVYNGIRQIAEDMGVSEEDVVDDTILLSSLSEEGVVLASTTLMIAANKWNESHK